MSIVTKEKQESDTRSLTLGETTQAHFSARQTLSILEKIAFWACVLRVLDGIGGIITLTIFDGAPSQDIVIATAEWVVIGIILATRSRWAPLVSTVLSTIVLYLTFTQPYLIQSVSNPKGPVGGYGHFFGEVLALACEIVVVGASLGSAVQKHFPGSKQARRATTWMPAGMTLVASTSCLYESVR